MNKNDLFKTDRFIVSDLVSEAGSGKPELISASKAHPIILKVYKSEDLSVVKIVYYDAMYKY